jgi:hypothetical protein
VGNRRLWQREDVEEWGIATRRICPEHKHPSIGEQVVAGRLVGRCADDFLYAVPPSFVPGAENQA